MEDAWGEANVLLELLLHPSAPGALLKDHLLVHLILPKGVGGNQVSSGRERPESVLAQSLASVPPGSPRGPRHQPNCPPSGVCTRVTWGTPNHMLPQGQRRTGPLPLLVGGDHVRVLQRGPDQAP